MKKEKSEFDGLPPAEQRVLLEDRLRRDGRDDLAAILVKCREPLPLLCVCCGSAFSVETGCRKRWCPVCAVRISAKRVANLEGMVAKMRDPAHLMLSEKNTTEISGSVGRMLDAFRGFRRTDFWKGRVLGGVVGCEVTNRGRGWHVHLHAVIDCPWLAVETPRPSKRHSREQRKQLCKRAQNELAEVWGGYLGQGKAAVWVRRSSPAVLVEIVKYVIKPGDLLSIKGDIGSLIDEIDEGRMMSTFGHMHGSSANFVGRDEVQPHLVPCKGCGVENSTRPEKVLAFYHRRPELADDRTMELWSRSIPDLLAEQAVLRTAREKLRRMVV